MNECVRDILAVQYDFEAKRHNQEGHCVGVEVEIKPFEASILDYLK